MIVNIETVAKKLKIKTPDLITRPVGRRMYRAISEMVQHAGSGEVVIFDFEKIKVIDSSFIDEFIVKMLLDSINGKKDFYIKLRNISGIAETNIDSVLRTYSSYNNKKIVVITDDICHDNKFYIGSLKAEEKEIIDYMRINRITGLNDLAEYMKGEISDIKKIIDYLNALRLIRSEGKDRYSAV